MGVWLFWTRTASRNFKPSFETVIRLKRARALIGSGEARPRTSMPLSESCRELPFKAPGNGKAGLVRKDNLYRSNPSRLAPWKRFSVLIKRKVFTGYVF